MALKGVPKTEEHKRKISEALKGQVSPWKGKKHTEVTKQKIKEARKKQIFTDGTRRKMSEAHQGSKSNLWKGGRTKRKKHDRDCLEYRLWRRDVFKRDNYKCVKCGFASKGKRPSDIHADHIKPFTLFPELRFEIENGRTLCIPCHRKTDTYGKSYAIPTNDSNKKDSIPSEEN